MKAPSKDDLQKAIDEVSNLLEKEALARKKHLAEVRAEIIAEISTIKAETSLKEKLLRLARLAKLPGVILD